MASLALVGVRAIEVAIRLFAVAVTAGPSRGRPGGHLVRRSQKVKTPSDSTSATQRFAYVVRKVTGSPRHLPTAETSTGA